MSKAYQNIQEELIMAAEPTPSRVESGTGSSYPEARRRSTAAQPVATYGVRSSYAMPKNAISTRERIMTSTMSVDEYFDELIDQVREDYANL